MIYQRTIAEQLKISGAHLSDVLNGVKEPGKKTAKKMAEFCNRPWTDFLTMTPGNIRETLFTAAEKQLAALDPNGDHAA